MCVYIIMLGFMKIGRAEECLVRASLITWLELQKYWNYFGKCTKTIRVFSSQIWWIVHLWLSQTLQVFNYSISYFVSRFQWMGVHVPLISIQHKNIYI